MTISGKGIVILVVVAALIGLSFYAMNVSQHNDTVERLAVPQIKHDVQTYISDSYGRKYTIDEVTLVASPRGKVDDHIVFNVSIVHGGGNALRRAGVLDGIYSASSQSVIELTGELTFRNGSNDRTQRDTVAIRTQQDSTARVSPPNGGGFLSGSAWVKRGDGSSDILRGLKVYILRESLSDTQASELHQEVIATLIENLQFLKQYRTKAGDSLDMTGVSYLIEQLEADISQLERNPAIGLEVGRLFKSIRNAQEPVQAIKNDIAAFFGNEAELVFAKDSTWPQIASFALEDASTTDVDGKYAVNGLGEGRYWVYAIYEDQYSLAEWMELIDLSGNNNLSFDLYNENAAFIVSKH